MLGILFSTAISLSAPAAGPLPQEAPPGLVLVKGERTVIGSDPKDVEPLILANQDIGNVFAGETPKHTVEVADFYLGVTEVTNEQSAVFARPTAPKPPYLWGEKALNEGRQAFLKEEAEKAKAAREKGQRYDRQTFDAEQWWEENWQGAEWEVPSDRKTHPVSYVPYADARAYAAWAGLRLMTEFEFQCAARGKDDRVYPWGDEWIVDGSQSRHGERDEAAPVGSFPKGAVNGIHDLVGNVFEWTTSPYEPYKGYKPFKITYKEGKRKNEIRCEAGFDPNMRVLVGGSFKQAEDGVRISVRMPTGRHQSAEALGFRVAASTAPGLDVATDLIEERLDFRTLPDGTDFLPRATLIKQRWLTQPGTSNVEGYAVIQAYERMLFTPVDEIDLSSVSDLGKLSIEAPVVLGLLSLSRTIAEPLLDGGTYSVRYRAANKLPKLEKDEEEPAWSKVDGFDEEEDLYFLYSADGTPQVAFAAPAPKLQRMAPGSIALEPYVPPKKIDEDNPPPPPVDTLRFTFTIQSKKKRDGFRFELPIKLKVGDVDDTWK